MVAAQLKVVAVAQGLQTVEEEAVEHQEVAVELAVVAAADSTAAGL